MKLPQATQERAVPFDLAHFQTSEGDIRILEFQRLPFTPRRDFFITNAPPPIVRGQHAHYACHQLFRGIHDEFELRVWAPGDGVPFVALLSPERQAVWVPPRRWVEVRGASKAAVVHVLCSHPWDPDDYVHQWERFEKLAR